MKTPLTDNERSENCEPGIKECVFYIRVLQIGILHQY